jgi:hypothetical protein
MNIATFGAWMDDTPRDDRSAAIEVLRELLADRQPHGREFRLVRGSRGGIVNGLQRAGAAVRLAHSTRPRRLVAARSAPALGAVQRHFCLDCGAVTAKSRMVCRTCETSTPSLWLDAALAFGFGLAVGVALYWAAGVW